MSSSALSSWRAKERSCRRIWSVGLAVGLRPEAARVPDDPNVVALPLGTTVREAEKALILKTLEHTNNNKTRAAEILAVSLKTLHNKMKEYSAQESEPEAAPWKKGGSPVL